MKKYYRLMLGPKSIYAEKIHTGLFNGLMHAHHKPMH
jgi:hypothetical protein